jgi:hypothetical protein
LHHAEVRIAVFALIFVPDFRKCRAEIAHLPFKAKAKHEQKYGKRKAAHDTKVVDIKLDPKKR